MLAYLCIKDAAHPCLVDSAVRVGPKKATKRQQKGNEKHKSKQMQKKANKCKKVQNMQKNKKMQKKQNKATQKKKHRRKKAKVKPNLIKLNLFPYIVI